MYVYYDYAHYHESDADADADGGGGGNAGSLAAPAELGYDSKLKLPQRGCIQLVYIIPAG